MKSSQLYKDRIKALKQDLALVFDDNLKTEKWHNYTDYIIIGVILLSTLEIFLSTFDIDPSLRKILYWIEIGCLIFFTIEVTLRIWVAPLVNPKYQGIKGRLRYCLSFHGLIDIISTYPFYLQWLIPFPVTWMRSLRMARTIRMFRVSRYMKSWDLLENTIKSKRRELLVSMQFLLIVTFILSLILFFCEHEVQPENYDNGFSSVLWAFGQYIGDPGGFAENPPMTILGKVIACIVGLLGIAIVAVPAGILGAGFTEAIECENNKETLKRNQDKLSSLFERKLDRPTGFQAVSFYKTIIDAQARTGLTENEIMETITHMPDCRIINLASTIPVEKHPNDCLAIEHFPLNRPYGVCIDRHSKVTIISPASFADATGGIFSFYLALIGGFNYISCEIGQTLPYRSLFTIKDGLKYTQEEKAYFDDLSRLMEKPGSWNFNILPASGANEIEYDTQFHFGIGNAKGNEAFEGPDLLVKNVKLYKQFYEIFSAKMQADFNILCDNGKCHATNNPSLWMRQLNLPSDSNSVITRIAWSVILWNDRRLMIAKTFADMINQVILGKAEIEIPAVLKQKEIGYMGYDL